MSEYTKQAEDFLKKHAITFKAVFVDSSCPPWCNDAKHIHGDKYRVTFRKPDSKSKKSFSVYFWNSLNDRMNNTIPSAYDVLSTLQDYDPEDFKTFCAMSDYDTDSRKAEKIYKLVKKEWLKVSAFFTDEEITELHEIN